MRVCWRVLESGDRQVEAQIFEPEIPIPNLIRSDFPGAGATLFEQRHAASLVEFGYTLVVLRHTGTPAYYGLCAVDGEPRGAPPDVGAGKGEAHLGGGSSSVADWLLEPLTALNVLSPDYENIFVIGNSFGALSSLWSFTMPGVLLEKSGA